MITYKPLLKTLIDKGLQKQDLRETLGLSSRTIAKLNKNEYISLETIDKICDYLNCEIKDVVEHIKTSK